VNMIVLFLSTECAFRKFQRMADESGAVASH
jgi:hypothetical protein